MVDAEERILTWWTERTSENISLVTSVTLLHFQVERRRRAPWDEVVGCIVLGSHPHWEITIQHTVFLKVKTELRKIILHFLMFNISDSIVTVCAGMLKEMAVLVQCEVVDCIVVG